MNGRARAKLAEGGVSLEKTNGRARETVTTTTKKSRKLFL